MRRHPWLPAVVITRPVLGPHGADLLEHALEVLADHPAGSGRKLEAFALLNALTALFAQNEQAAGDDDAHRRSAYLGHVAAAGTHPRIAAVLASLTGDTPHDQFDEIVLRQVRDGRARVRGGRGGVGVLAGQLVDHQLGQVIPGGNVVIQRHVGDAQLGGDPAHGDRLQALGIGDPHGDRRDGGPVVPLRRLHPANGRLMTVKRKITVADPGAELRWVSSLPGIISGEHRFTLTPADGGTRLEQSETFRGLLAAFPLKTFARAEVSFQGLNEVLKKRAEGS